MEISVGLFLFLFTLAFFCEFIDSSLGMGYGTILSPVLIIMGFDPLVAVPAVLLSQAFGGFTAAIFHHQFENASFTRASKDLKIVFVISGFGILATILAAVMTQVLRTSLRLEVRFGGEEVAVFAGGEQPAEHAKENRPPCARRLVSSIDRGAKPLSPSPLSRECTPGGPPDTGKAWDAYVRRLRSSIGGTARTSLLRLLARLLVAEQRRTKGGQRDS